MVNTTMRVSSNEKNEKKIKYSDANLQAPLKNKTVG